MELVIILVIIFAIDIVIASIITKIITKPLDIGTLRIDTSDPDGPFMFLELSKDVDTVASKKYVILKVNLKSYISQK
ncbi:beta-lactamase induction signal transducer protein [Anaerotruncus sp. 1XD42-93]|uniref:beta-lactamase induction signal transducer protein n=1 Tax=Anaerotruncus sp. 1XD42-93 TaxID=2320853 RepID=UPI000EA3DF54|nr:beta-lactamase induction signal transducer protein [Anaerotruncus sp. 1XD42-93]NBK18139.1 beta-lactamase induction signal transducer protein [Anaerotruncus sp. 1XD42-93]NCE73474.1 beta-lactamase induction signal transducer protein [Anaerotruncus sp. X29]RKJ92301.1 beta-lactamase induction signal transducer protein [Anaerotruncus sp. 1XD22-93]